MRYHLGYNNFIFISIHDADSALAPGNKDRPGCLIPENNFCCDCKDVVCISPPSLIDLITTHPPKCPFEKPFAR